MTFSSFDVKSSPVERLFHKKRAFNLVALCSGNRMTNGDIT